MADAILGEGTLLKRNGTAITGVGDITGPGLSTTMVDITHMESPNNAEEFIAGLKNYGELTFTINFIPDDATHTGLYDDWNNRTLQSFELVFNNAANTTWAFSAYVSAFQPAPPVKDKVTASITLSGITSLSIT